MPITDVQDDRPGFEEGEAIFFISQYLSEGLRREVAGLLHFLKGEESDLIGHTCLFESPSDPHVACQPHAAIR